MNDKEDFLARWSRRKREAERPEEAPSPATPCPAPRNKASDAADRTPGPGRPDGDAFDPTTLPSLDLIGADSDVRAFLARGVPAALTREALRRVWSADPAIRDFVGLAENSWDFNAPGGVPGFGPMLPSTAAGAPAEMVRQVADSEALPSADSAAADAVPEQPPGPRAPDSPAGINVHRNVKLDGDAAAQPPQAVESSPDRMMDKQPQDVASPEARKSGEPDTVVPARRHGGALPS